MRVDEPGIRHPGTAPHGRIDIGTDPQRWHRLLHWHHGAGCVVEFEMRTFESNIFFRPEALDRIKALFETRSSVLCFGAEGLEFHVPVPDARAKDEASP